MEIRIDYSEAMKNHNKAVRLLQEVASRKCVIKIDEEKTYANGKKVETIAFYMEYGQDELNVHYPARPFWRNTMQQYEDKIRRRFASNLQAVLDGKITPYRLYEDLGKQFKTYLRKTIKEGNFIPLNESTTAKRIREGKGTQPLLDTRLLYNSIVYEVV